MVYDPRMSVEDRAARSNEYSRRGSAARLTALWILCTSGCTVYWRKDPT